MMDVLEFLREVLQSKPHLVQLELDLVLGNNGNPRLVLSNGQSELSLCLLGSGESLVLLARPYLIIQHGEC
jgi:hypothetical protein